MDSSKTLIIVDASAIGRSSCILRFYRQVVDGLTSKINNNDIEFGTAFHKFRAIWREKGEAGFGEAIIAAKNHYEETPMHIKKEKSYLTTNFLVKVCFEYSEKYKNDHFETLRRDEEVFLEMKFCIPYYVDEDVEVLVAATMDDIGKWRGGIYCLCDAKTTGMWDVDKYFKSFLLNSQLLFYRWMIRKYAEIYPESVYTELDKNNIGAFIDGVFYKGKETPVEYRRSDAFIFSEESIQEFNWLLDAQIKKLVMWIKMNRASGKKPPREGIMNGACETKYSGLCDYALLCTAPDEESSLALEQYHFTKKFYNPLEFQL